ncbi:hypothetical protein [Polaromonas sp. LjRoot131]|uniref:hypothetical protein n=1 Tax=Polaromonas sp. LjRoot131 TaxID=3342262 RepID=UPI003ECD0BEB
MLTLARRILVALGLARTQVWQPGHYFSSGDEYQRWLESGTARIRDMVDMEELRLLLAHRNGYLREAALRRAGELHATALWTEVLGLCNDWVAPIRARAKRVSLGWLRDADISTLLPHLPALAELASRRREDHAAFVAQFESRLMEDQNLTSLFETAGASDSRKLARYCFALLERSAFPQARLIELGLAKADVTLQGRALQLIRSLSAGEQAGYALSLLASRRNYLRWYGLDMLWRADPAGAREVALGHLLSPYAALRDKAFKLSGLSREALLALAEQRLRSPGAGSSDIRVGLLLLASGGKKDCAGLVHSIYLKHPAPTVRGAALLTLARLSPEEAGPLLLPAVVSEFSAVGRAAMLAALALELKPSQAQWRELAAQANSATVAQRMHRWAHSMDKWLELAVLLEIACLHPQHRPFCFDGTRRWTVAFNRSWEALDAETREWIFSNLALLDGMGMKLDGLKFFLD